MRCTLSLTERPARPGVSPAPLHCVSASRSCGAHVSPISDSAYMCHLCVTVRWHASLDCSFRIPPDTLLFTLNYCSNEGCHLAMYETISKRSHPDVSERLSSAASQSSPGCCLPRVDAVDQGVWRASPIPPKLSVSVTGPSCTASVCMEESCAAQRVLCQAQFRPAFPLPAAAL